MKNEKTYTPKTKIKTDAAGLWRRVYSADLVRPFGYMSEIVRYEFADAESRSSWDRELLTIRAEYRRDQWRAVIELTGRDAKGADAIAERLAAQASAFADAREFAALLESGQLARDAAQNSRITAEEKAEREAEREAIRAANPKAGETLAKLAADTLATIARETKPERRYSSPEFFVRVTNRLDNVAQFFRVHCEGWEKPRVNVYRVFPKSAGWRCERAERSSKAELIAAISESRRDGLRVACSVAAIDSADAKTAEAFTSKRAAKNAGRELIALTNAAPVLKLAK